MAGQDLIAVVGGGLPGLAAAARLSRAGHPVVVLEARAALPRADVATEPGGEVFTLPSVWRDLFIKSGPGLDAELGRAGLSLAPAPPRHYRFADGSTLELPSERGEQWATLTAALGEPAAIAWRDLLDALDDVWQTLRTLALESEPQPGTLASAVRELPRRSLADVAAALPSAELTEIVLDVAARLGQDPRRLPGWHAVRLSIERTFGRWHLVRDGRTVPASTLVEALIARLAARGVEVRTGVVVEAIRRGPVVHTSAGTLHPAAVISTVDPFTHADLTRERADQAIARRLRRGAGPGPAWRGQRTLAELPVLEPSLARVLVASPWSVGGPDSWAQLLTGALATYHVHEALTGEDIRPTNREIGPGGRPRPVRRGR